MSRVEQGNRVSILVEDLAMRMAAAARIKVATHSLQCSEEGVLHHIVESRVLGRRKAILPTIEVSTLFETMELDSLCDTNEISCERVARVVADHSTTPKLECINLFEQLYFAWLIGDVHFGLERLRMVKVPDGFTSLAPTTLFTSSKLLNMAGDEESTILINSKRTDICSDDFVESMQRCGLERKIADNMIAKFANMVDIWCDMIEVSEIEEELCEQFKFMLFLRV